MPVQHLVSFKFQPSVSTLQISNVAQAFFALQRTCLSPSSGEAYITSIKGGKQDNPEGQDKGLTHVFLLEFKTDADRLYYISEDPAHEEFKAFVGPLVSDALVLDFTEGVW